MRWLGDGVRSLVLGAVGATAGCSDRAIGDDFGDGGSDEDGSSGDEGTDEGPSTTMGTSASSTSSATTTTTTATTSTSTTDSGTSDEGPMPACSEPDLWGHYSFCLGAPDANGECVCGDECVQETMSIYNEQDCCDSCSYGFGGVSCAEAVGDTCCFVTYLVEEGCGKGRPFVVDGAARVATIIGGGDWSELEGVVPRVAALDPRVRAMLEVSWLATARAEHASIASFARFTLQLLALGAPPDLLADAQRATLDEIEHARLAYALASAYRGAPLGPGPLEVADGLTDVDDRAAIVRSLVREGCVEETIAATEAAVAAARAEDPAVRRVLARIADDEARHAALAWRTAKWMIEQWPALASVAREAAAEACARREAAVAASDEGCPAHGVLGGRELHRVARECITRTIAPALAALT